MLAQRLKARLTVSVLVVTLLGLVAISTLFTGPEHTTHRLVVVGVLVGLFSMMLGFVMWGPGQLALRDIPPPVGPKVATKELTCIWASCTFRELRGTITAAVPVFRRVCVTHDGSCVDWWATDTISIAPPGGRAMDKTCSCCLDDFHMKSMVALLPCGHIFHDECIARWSVSGDSTKIPRCPTCRATFQLQSDMCEVDETVVVSM
mmetsp:Transcript_19053/g.35738  ORF Transcript_19053/g.35738 Transcript_19053/m.35738 type:complete len:205 (+) Transcript_19053:34-648(+)